MESWVDTEFDAVIVGTGPGGGSVAKGLAESGKRILVLEKGPGTAIKGNFVQTLRTTMIPGRSLHFTPELLALMHGIILGGSSINYYACAFDPPYKLFEEHGVDLHEEVAEVKDELPVAPLDDDLIGPAAQRIMASAKALGFEWNKLPKIVYQDKCRLNCDKCTMGCPYGAKWTSRMYLDETREHGSVVVTGAHVHHVVRQNGTAVGVAFTHEGKRQQAFARSVVLAAGGMGTPMILRRSGIEDVGNDYFFDPLIFAIGEVDDLDGGKEFPMAAGCNLHDDGIVLTDLVLPRWLYWLFTAQVFRFDRLFAHGRSLPIMVKVRDELGGHLTKRGGVHKRLGIIERARLMKGYDIARKVLMHAGARRIFKTWYLAVHPGGTAKIGDVVDVNLQTEVKNLFVCDASVIPGAWGLPPSLTVMALGKRLSKHLSNSVL